MIYNLIKALEEWLRTEMLGIRPWSVLQVFDQLTFRAVAAVILAFLIVALMGKRTIRWLIRQKIGDQPEFYHADLNRLTRQKNATPTMGGLLIAVAILVAVLLLADMGNFYVQMALLCVVCYAGLGAVDDWLKLTSARRGPGSREGLYAWEKFTFQVCWALLLGYFIHRHGTTVYQEMMQQVGGQVDLPNMTHILNWPFQRTWLPATEVGARLPNPNLIELGPLAFGILTVLVISGSSNAANLTDGMDGLAGGILAIVSFAFMVLCLIVGIERTAVGLLMPHIPGSGELAVVAGAMVGASIGFLWYNCHPAQVFMGDTGSLPLGALIGFIAVVIRQEVLLLIIGGVLVMEVLSVVMQVGYFKATGGSRLFRCSPIHHHFHLLGWTEGQVVVRFWLISALLAAIALATVKLR